MTSTSVSAPSFQRTRSPLDNLSLAEVAAEGRWDDVMAMLESATTATIDVDAVSKLGRTALWLAANEGHAAAVQALLQTGADANKADTNGYAPLSRSASAPIATMLIERGASVNAANTFGQTALSCAAQEGDADVVEALLKAGADANKADDDGNAPLSGAASAPIAKMLIERGADVNATNNLGETALLTAALDDRADVVEALLQAGADVSKAAKNGCTPLTFANAPIAKMLIERGADVNVANTRGQTRLWVAARYGDADVVEALLQAGADVNKADEDGYAPLSAAASAKAHEDGFAAITTITKMLIDHGADVNATNNRGETALVRAMIGDSADVVEALLQAGADVNKADASGRLPLTVAANHSRWSNVTLLVRSNRIANVDALGSSGKTALWMALDEPEESYLAEAREAATALICAGADVDFQWIGVSLLRSGTQRWISDVLLLLSAGATTVGVSAADCRNCDVMALMMAGGAVWTDLEIERAILHFVDDDDIDNIDERLVTPAEILSQVPAAKKWIEQFGFARIRARVFEICIALQSLAVPAPQLIEIVTAACVPFAAQLPYHYLWDAVVLVKHYKTSEV
jgi:ankyrin repeat protein